MDRYSSLKSYHMNSSTRPKGRWVRTYLLTNTLTKSSQPTSKALNKPGSTITTSYRSATRHLYLLTQHSARLTVQILLVWLLPMSILKRIGIYPTLNAIASRRRNLLSLSFDLTSSLNQISLASKKWPIKKLCFIFSMKKCAGGMLSYQSKGLNHLTTVVSRQEYYRSCPVLNGAMYF